MEEHFSTSAIDRLPSAIKGLNKDYQRIYISLRLRESENKIAGSLNLSLEETRQKINKVRHELIKAGQLYLIEDPQFISIHADNPDTQEIQVAAKELPVDKKLMIKEFNMILKEAVDDLPKYQSQLLKLRYNHQMSAKDILGFCNKIGISLIPDKEITELKEQDIFYALNTALKEVLKRLKIRYKDESSFGMDNLKYIFEEFGI
ncbi:MAG: hypothetical protein AABY78_10795 [Nitrospirota bacterium]